VEDVARPPIPTVVRQHVEDAATLRSTRTHLDPLPTSSCYISADRMKGCSGRGEVG
jgi:hypothetical protein